MVVFLSLTPDPPEVADFETGDKLGHLVAYFTLMLWFANLYRKKKAQITMGMAFIAMGAVLELLQGLSGYRIFQYTDMVANAAGIFLGWLTVRTTWGYFLVKLDSSLDRAGIPREKLSDGGD